MNWVDWTIVAIVGIAALSGLRRGMILTVTGLIAQLGSLVAAFLLTRPVSIFLETRFGWAASLAGWAAGHIHLPAEFATTKVSELTSGELWSMLEESGLPAQFRDAIVSWIAEAPGGVDATLEMVIHQSMGILLLYVLVFLALWILSGWLIRAFGRSASDAAKAIGAGGADRLGGLLIGLAKGVLIVSLLLGLSMPFLTTWSAEAVAAIDASLLAPWLLKGFYFAAPWLRQAGQAIWERLQ